MTLIQLRLMLFCFVCIHQQELQLKINHTPHRIALTLLNKDRPQQNFGTQTGLQLLSQTVQIHLVPFNSSSLTMDPRISHHHHARASTPPVFSSHQRQLSSTPSSNVFSKMSAVSQALDAPDAAPLPNTDHWTWKCCRVRSISTYLSTIHTFALRTCTRRREERSQWSGVVC